MPVLQSNQTTQSFFDSDLRLPSEFIADMTDIRDVIQWDRRRQCRGFVDHRRALNNINHLINHFTERQRVFFTAAEIIQAPRDGLINKGATRSEERRGGK